MRQIHRSSRWSGSLSRELSRGALSLWLLLLLTAAGQGAAQSSTHIEFDLSHTESVGGVSSVLTDTNPGLDGGASLVETGQVSGVYGTHDVAVEARVLQASDGRARLSAEAEHVFDMSGTDLFDDVWEIGDSRLLARAVLEDVLTISDVPGSSASLEFYFQIRGRSEGEITPGAPFSDLFFTMDTPAQLELSTASPHSGGGLISANADLPDGYAASPRSEQIFIDEFDVLTLDIDPSVDVPIELRFEIEANTNVRNQGEAGSLSAVGFHRPSYWDNAAELVGVVVRDDLGNAIPGATITSGEGFEYPVEASPPLPFPPATFILSPVAVIDSDLGEFNPSLTPFEHMIDQSGLTVPFTSGQTGFDVHFSQANALRASGDFSGNWQSAVAFSLPLSGFVDFDLGGDYVVDRLAIWSLTFEDVRIQLADDPAGPWTEVASVTLPDHYGRFSYDAQILDLGGFHSARYVRFEIDSVYEIDPAFTYAIAGEVAASATPVPEPATPLLLLAGCAWVFGFSRTGRGIFFDIDPGTHSSPLSVARNRGPQIARFEEKRFAGPGKGDTLMLRRIPKRSTAAIRRLAYAIVLGLFMSSSASAAVFVVNSTGDTGDAVSDGICDTGNVIPDGLGNFVVECTLRAAIFEAEQTTARDQIHFTNALLYGSRGTATIEVPANFQQIDQPVDIDATTAPSWVSGGYPRVRLLGPGTSGGVDGLRFRTGASDSMVKGLAFQDFQYAVLLDTADDVHVDGCAFGYWREPGAIQPVFLPLRETLAGNTNGVRVASGASGTKIGRRVLGVGFPVVDFEFAGEGNVFADNEWAIVNHGEGTEIVGNAIGVGIDRSRTMTQSFLPAATLGNRYGIWVTNLSGLRIGRLIENLGFRFEGEGNVISNNEQGIYISEAAAGGGGAGFIQANLIGTDGEGLEDRGNTNYGIRVDGSVNDLTIGGVPAAANVVSANGTRGIDIGYESSGGITITGNILGLGQDESTPLGNGGEGMFLGSGSPLVVTNNTVGNSGSEGINLLAAWFSAITDAQISDNFVGTNDAGEAHPNAGDGIQVEQNVFANVEISRNTVGASFRGIHLDQLSRQVAVFDNYLGTNAAGADLGNQFAGLRSASDEGGHEIGRIGAGNVVGWNGSHGLAVDNAMDASTIVANRIGVMPDGAPIPNEQNGIFIREGNGAAAPVIVGSDLGTNPIDYAGRANSIQFNGESGIDVAVDAWTVVRANQMAENGTLAIDLNADGATANDLGDADLGANALQNHPELDDAGSSHNFATGELTIEYRVPSFTTESDYDLRVDFYVADVSGTEPMLWVGEDVYPAAEANVQRSVTFFSAAEIPVDASIVATATDGQGRTSEVSPPVFVPEPGFAAGLCLSLLGLSVLNGGSKRREARFTASRA